MYHLSLLVSFYQYFLAAVLPFSAAFITEVFHLHFSIVKKLWFTARLSDHCFFAVFCKSNIFSCSIASFCDVDNIRYVCVIAG